MAMTAKLGSVAFCMWGILHTIGAIMILLALISGGAGEGYAIYGLNGQVLPDLIPMFNDNDPWRGTGDGRPGRSTPQSAAKAAVEDCDAPGAWAPAHPKGRAYLIAGVVENPQWTYGSISGFLLAGSQIRPGAMGHYH